MAIEVFNRYEKKFIIDDDTYHKLKPQLEEYMEVDSYSRNGDFYTICNIYYDTPDNDIIRKSIERPAYKEKLRIRSYGVAMNKDKVYLEIKKKFNGCVNKRRTSFTFEEVMHYLNTKERPKVKSYMNAQVLDEIDYMLLRYPKLQPALYLSYDRNAMFGMDNKEFRITFDTNIRTRRYDLALNYGIYGDLLLPEGKWIMEAKMNQAAPLWFAKLLSRNEIYPTTFSKYGEEYRRIVLNNGTIHTNSDKYQMCI